MNPLLVALYFKLIKPTPEIIEAIKKQQQATTDLVKAIEKNPESFDRLINSILINL